LRVAIVTSAMLLALLQIFRRHFQSDVRTALADLVLLTPLLTLACQAILGSARL
jgi:hypothetical protein